MRRYVSELNSVSYHHIPFCLSTFTGLRCETRLSKQKVRLLVTFFTTADAQLVTVLVGYISWKNGLLLAMDQNNK